MNTLTLVTAALVLATATSALAGERPSPVLEAGISEVQWNASELAAGRNPAPDPSWIGVPVSPAGLTSFGEVVVAEGSTVVGVARTASKFTIYATECARVRGVSVQAARTMVFTYVLIGFKMAGDNFKRINDKELARRKVEVKATGVEPWCQYQSSDPLIAATGVFY